MYLYTCISLSISLSLYLYIYISIYTNCVFATADISEGGMIRLETLIELKFVTWSFSSLSSYQSQTSSSPSSDSRQQHLRQQYPLPS